MDYPSQYKSQIITAIESLDLVKVSQVINEFKQARSHGRRIFVCGVGGSDSIVSQLLCDIVKGSSFNRSSRFRILALSDQLPRLNSQTDSTLNDRVFVEQLKNFAEPEDVVVGLSACGDPPSVINAIEYASWIGCRTVTVTGGDGGRLAEMAELNVNVPATHMGSIEDTHMIICHMIAYYFVDVERGWGTAGMGSGE